MNKVGAEKIGRGGGVQKKLITETDTKTKVFTAVLNVTHNASDWLYNSITTCDVIIYNSPFTQPNEWQ